MVQQELVEKLGSIVWKCLDPTENQAFVFGSMATNEFNRSSDLDLGITGKRLDAKTYYMLEESLEYSDFPYRVDIVDFNTVSDSFRRVASQRILPLSPSIT